MTIVDVTKLKANQLPQKTAQPETLITDNLSINAEATALAEQNKSQEVNQTLNASNQTTRKLKSSYQILNEPILAIKGEEQIDYKKIANSNHLAEAVFKNLPDKLAAVGKLAVDSESVNNSEINNCLNVAANNCVAANLQILDQPADGSIIVSPFNKYSLSANNLNFNSDNSTFIRTPLIQTISQNHQVTANNSFTVVSDLQVKQSKTDVTFTGSSVVSTENATMVATKNIAQSAAVNRQVGTEEYSALGKDINLSAEKKLTSASKGTIENFADQSISSQSKNLNLFAVSGAKSGTETKASAPEGTVEQDTSFVIVNSNQNSTSVIVGNNKGMYNSSTGYNYSLSDQGTTISSKRSTNIQGGSSVSVAGNKNSSFGKPGSKTFVGSINIALPDFKIPKPLSIPGFPVLPKLNPEDLKNCIPKKPEISDPTANTQVPVLTDPNNAEVDLESAVEIPTQNPPSDKQTPPAISATEQTNSKNINTFTRLDVYFHSNDGSEIETDEGEIEGEAESETSSIPFTISNSEISNLFTSTEAKPTPAEIQALNLEFSTLISEIIPLYPKRELAEFLTDNTFLTAAQLEKISTIKALLALTPTSKATFDQFIAAKYTLLGIGYLFESNDYFLEEYLQGQGNFKIESNKTEELSQARRDTADFYLENTDSIKQGLDYLNLPNQQEIIDLGKDVICGDNQAILARAIDKGIDTALDQLSGKDNPYFNSQVKTGIRSIYGDIITKQRNDQPITGTDSLNYLAEITNLVAVNSENPSLQTAAQLSKATQAVFNRLKAELEINPDLSQAQIFNLTEDAIATLAENFDLPVVTEINRRINQGKDIYGSVKNIQAAVEANDIRGLLSTDISGLANNLIGEARARQLQKTFDTIIEGIDTFNTVRDLTDTLSQLPDVLEQMSDFKIAKLNQIKVVFQCLELLDKLKNSFNSVKSLYERIKDSANSAAALDNLSQQPEYFNLLPENAASLATGQTIKKLELLPRLIQTANTISQLEPNQVESKLIDLDQGYLNNLVNNLNVPLATNSSLAINQADIPNEIALPEINCNVNLKRTLLESTVEILQTKEIYFQFKLAVQTNEKLNSPHVRDTIQIYVPSFELISGEIATVYSDEYQFTPSVYNFIVESYDQETNLGTASLADFNYSIVLQKQSGVLIEFNYKAWQKSIFPIVKDAYLI